MIKFSSEPRRLSWLLNANYVSESEVEKPGGHTSRDESKHQSGGKHHENPFGTLPKPILHGARLNCDSRDVIKTWTQIN